MPARWRLAPLVLWCVIAVPYVVAGPNDLEEYFTGAASTKLAVESLRHGSLPLWNVDMAIGMPQPLRFHFITHPLAPLCAVADCAVVLRGIAALHVLLGAVFVGLLVVQVTGNRAIGSLASIVFLLSSSVVQPLLVDDWPITAINESAIPVLLYGALALPSSGRAIRSIIWVLALGGLAGLLTSMSFPFVAFLIVGAATIGATRFSAKLPWLLLAALIAVTIGAGQIYHLYDQLALVPASVGRTDHRDAQLWIHAWSAFLRPLAPPDAGFLWRTVFIGPPFAVLAVFTAVAYRDPVLRPFRLGLLVSAIAMVIPEQWLFNVVTARWVFRAGLNVFGIVLASYGLHRWTEGAPEKRSSIARRIVAVQLLLVVTAVAPMWYSVASAATGTPAARSFRLSRKPGIAADIAALHKITPGRVAFAERAGEALRQLEFAPQGLAPNQLQTLGVPSLTTVAFGVMADELYPMRFTLESETRTTRAAVMSDSFLDVLGVRYVLAFPDETVAAGLHEVRRYSGAAGLRVYENPDPWPEAFFVETLSDAPIVGLPECPHSRFFCADLGRAGLIRAGESVNIVRDHDGLRLEFDPADRSRNLVVTQWYREGWTVTAGRAVIVRTAEQLVGLRVPTGETRVDLRYRPALRAGLFWLGAVGELLVSAGLVFCLWHGRRGRGRVAPQAISPT